MAASELFNKILNESQEQLNELSNETLTSYSKKAKAQLVDISRKRGPKKASDKKAIQKRGAGIDKVAAIKSKRRAAERDVLSKKSHTAFTQAAHKVLTDHGYELTHSGKSSNIYTKHDPDTNTLHVAKHHIGYPSTQDSHHNHEGEIKLVSTNGTTSTVRNPGGFGVYSQFRDNPDIDLVDHHAEKIDGELKSHHRWSKDNVFNRHMNEEVLSEDSASLKKARERLDHHVNKTEDYMKAIHNGLAEYHRNQYKKGGINWGHVGSQEDIHHTLRDLHDNLVSSGYIKSKIKPVNEEVEIDEASGEEYRKKLLSYQSPARKKWIADQMKKKATTNEEVEQIDELSTPLLSRYKKKATDDYNESWLKNTNPKKTNRRGRAIDKVDDILAKRKLAKEEVELNEGRGRPRKDGTKAEGDDRPHIIMQLRKHISLRGANPIKFADGSAHKITDGQARAALVLHQNLKSSIEKGNFEKKLDASHDSFQTALKSPETAGHDTPKPGITLPALNRINRLKFASGE